MAAESIKNFLALPLKELNIKAMIAAAMEEKADEIMELNKQQLDKGLDAKGESLGRYKNFKYKNRFQPVDLKLRGEYRDKFTLAASTETAEIFSQDQKAGFLEKRYGQDIYGISTNYKSNVAELIKEPLGLKIKAKLLKQ